MGFYWFARGVCSLILKIKGYKIEGLENIPSEGPVIIASNHISMWDPVIVGCALPRQVIFMAKQELFDAPLIGKIFPLLQVIPVKRGKGDISAIRSSINVLKEGRVLGLFPEGHRSKSGDIQEAMTGIALIMEKSKAPILPVKVFGSKGLLRQIKGNMGIIIGKPFCADQLSVPQGIEDRRFWIANEIMRVVNEI
ncbi:MAG: 1-acyl-sn-glycerol-3-phosphate acyltransferase [Candidatus Dichloromethanomonas elyunquensis]|nr:MAG: 1-acyl-sn-glycerol-3-phosphate acyltransferase [Candidatus Dichloromethanomonas elyunquensis]